MPVERLHPDVPLNDRGTIAVTEFTPDLDVDALVHSAGAADNLMRRLADNGIRTDGKRPICRRIGKVYGNNHRDADGHTDEKQALKRNASRQANRIKFSDFPCSDIIPFRLNNNAYNL